jgi:hypothetical protein
VSKKISVAGRWSPKTKCFAEIKFFRIETVPKLLIEIEIYFAESLPKFAIQKGKNIYFFADTY